MNTTEEKQITAWDELEDGELVKLAQAGEREAFGELVRRHRSKMYGYARAYTQEAYLAEDIVQEALMRAFLHLGKLVDEHRFLPWVHRIVRNRAFTKMKSAPVAKEQTFTTLSSFMPPQEHEQDDLSRLDEILYRLRKYRDEESAVVNVPESRLIQKENLEVLTGIIQCLKPRERRIFEAHFFDQLSPAEISKLFQLSPSNVYQVLSRSRKKVVQQKIRFTVDSYIKSRRDLGTMASTVLTYKESLMAARTWTSAAETMYKMLQYTDKPLSMPMVMGLSGHAFRINIIPDNVHIAGPTAYDFSEILVEGFHHIGFHASFVDGMKPDIGQNNNLLPPEQKGVKAMEKRDIHRALPEALDLIHQSLDRGIPVMAWDLFFPEFGIIYGYDDHERVFHTEECGRKDKLSYENLGRGVCEDLFVLSIGSGRETTLREQLKEALAMTIEHYEGKEKNVPADSVKGIAAYDAWMDSFEKGAIEPNGNAYNIAVYRDARNYAALFFKELTDLWRMEDHDGDAKITGLIKDAEAAYRRISNDYDRLHERFPYPEGGAPNEVDGKEAIRLLERIKAEEIRAVEILRNIMNALN
ncbi:RNA polymerase sigma factor [Paenibacillus sp. DMB20]|uniref:RNA polymerase sigma factor n=1 Tax=Paenibacillus sp. DMB20 TaxID=1642570 RepID=UPI000627AC49|nr:RNA polymerase sigma factor [Paenibacillus sp. DMB20]KKO52403.1 RNA polymerase subunit sigma-24 [Paenibacillus sp. DMB20]